MWSTRWLLEKGATENQGTGLPPSCAQRLKENIPFQVSFPKCICICVLDVNNFSHNYNCICVLDVTHSGHKDTCIYVLYDTHLSVKYCKVWPPVSPRGTHNAMCALELMYSEGGWYLSAWEIEMQ